MKFMNFLKPVKNLNPEEVKKFINQKKNNEYQLLDVRQPKEYEIEHIPGTLLIPLPDLAQRIEELDKHKPTIVYCALGGRSRAASQHLLGNGFQEIYNLDGGIKAWHGYKAKGNEKIEMEFFQNDMDFENAFQLAHAMEHGLKFFYDNLKDHVEESLKNIFEKLSGFEEKHIKNLEEKYQQITGISFSSMGKISNTRELVEGDIRHLNDIIANRNEPYETYIDIFDLSMSIESQAFDLYVRMGRQSDDARTREVFFDIAKEEKTHLSYLAMEMEKYLKDPGQEV